MRGLPAAGILAVALATPVRGEQAAPAPSWADWVGDWQGKLKWSRCSASGEDNVSLPLDASDGAVAIDLSATGAALSELSLVEDNGGWLGREADVTVRVDRTKPDTLELAIDLESGCQVRGALTRNSVGIAACDRLA